MSQDYQKGRYDELLERHMELVGLYRDLQFQALTNVPRAGISGAMVHYYSGLRIDSRAIGWTIGATGIAFSLLASFAGLTPVTFGVPIAVFGLLFGLFSSLSKPPQEHRVQPSPPQQPAQHEG